MAGLVLHDRVFTEPVHSRKGKSEIKLIHSRGLLLFVTNGSKFKRSKLIKTIVNLFPERSSKLPYIVSQVTRGVIPQAFIWETPAFQVKGHGVTR